MRQRIGHTTNRAFVAGRRLRAPLAAIGLCLIIVSTTLALVPTAASAAGGGSATVDVVTGALPVPPGSDPAPRVLPGTAGTPEATGNADYPLPNQCTWYEATFDCQKVSPLLDVSLSTTEIESGDVIQATSTPIGTKCDLRNGPYSDCYLSELTYVAGTGEIFPYPRFPDPTPQISFEHGVDGVACYQYVPTCAIRVTYTGQLPSRWIAITGVSYQRTKEPPAAGIEYAIEISGPERVYQWYTVEQALFRVKGTDPTPNYGVSNGSLKMWPVAGSQYKRDYRHVTTDGKYHQTYGYFEMEAKLPYGRGPWPAFWLLNHDQADPYRNRGDVTVTGPRTIEAAAGTWWEAWRAIYLTR